MAVLTTLYCYYASFRSGVSYLELQNTYPFGDKYRLGLGVVMVKHLTICTYPDIVFDTYPVTPAGKGNKIILYNILHWNHCTKKVIPHDIFWVLLFCKYIIYNIFGIFYCSIWVVNLQGICGIDYILVILIVIEI